MKPVEGKIQVTLLLVVLACFPNIVNATYETQSAQAVQWLSGRQNSDGSWGSTEAEKFLYTIETVNALQAAGQRNSAYYQGITWLENHATPNADYLARWVRVLSAHGDNVSAAVNQLVSYQNVALPGHTAWGLSARYVQSPLDTAIVLQGLSNQGTSANIPAAITYLKTTQLNNGTDRGWPVGNETSSDAFTTAMVIKSLVPLQSLDSTLGTPIANAILTLQNKVGTTAPIYLQAHAAHAARLGGNGPVAYVWLNQLATTQGVNGSWSDRIYDTALSLRAFAAVDATDTTANQLGVYLPDAQLRAAVNSALGRNAMDSISRSELLRLTQLSAARYGIRDLTGLEWAFNLTSADLQNNNITSITALNGLTHLSELYLDGNPASTLPPPPSLAYIDNDIPTLPEWGVILMALILAGLAIRRQRQTGTTTDEWI